MHHKTGCAVVGIYIVFNWVESQLFSVNTLHGSQYKQMQAKYQVIK